MCIHGSLVYDCPYSCPIHPHTSEAIGGATSRVTRIHKCARWNVHYHPRGSSPSRSPYTTLYGVRLDSDDIPLLDRGRLRRRFGECGDHGRGVVCVPDEPLFDDSEEERGDSGSGSSDGSAASSPTGSLFVDPAQTGTGSSSLSPSLEGEGDETHDTEDHGVGIGWYEEHPGAEGPYQRVLPLVPRNNLTQLYVDSSSALSANFQLCRLAREPSRIEPGPQSPLVALPPEARDLIISSATVVQEQVEVETLETYDRGSNMGSQRRQWQLKGYIAGSGGLSLVREGRNTQSSNGTTENGLEPELNDDGSNGGGGDSGGDDDDDDDDDGDDNDDDDDDAEGVDRVRRDNPRASIAVFSYDSETLLLVGLVAVVIMLLIANYLSSQGETSVTMSVVGGSGIVVLMGL